MVAVPVRKAVAASRSPGVPERGPLPEFVVESVPAERSPVVARACWWRA